VSIGVLPLVWCAVAVAGHLRVSLLPATSGLGWPRAKRSIAGGGVGFAITVGDVWGRPYRAVPDGSFPLDLHHLEDARSRGDGLVVWVGMSIRLVSMRWMSFP
jgi:hypothetical protein